jgi:hypothetical protein
MNLTFSQVDDGAGRSGNMAGPGTFVSSITAKMFFAG